MFPDLTRRTLPTLLAALCVTCTAHTRPADKPTSGYVVRDGKVYVQTCGYFLPEHDLDGPCAPVERECERCDADTFRALEKPGELEEYAVDKTRVYYRKTMSSGEELLVVDGAEPGSFELLAHGYARDHARVYFRGHALSEVDRVSFTVFPTPHARADAMDCCRLYALGDPLERPPARERIWHDIRLPPVGTIRDQDGTFVEFEVAADDPEERTLLVTGLRQGLAQASWIERRGEHFERTPPHPVIEGMTLVRPPSQPGVVRLLAY